MSIRCFRISLLLAGLAWLLGCATLDRDECLVADWRLIGYHDGMAGRSATVLDRYRQDCAEYTVVPDLERYQEGRAQGLREYCRAANGYHLGESGHGYPAVCPQEMDEEFRTAWQQGRELFEARSAVRETNALIHDRKRELYYLKEDKGDKLSELIADDLQREQRLLILYEISEIELQMYTVESEIVALEQDLADQQAHLDYLTRNSVR